MDRMRMAEDLLRLAEKLVEGAPPKPKGLFKDISVGGKYKYKRKTFMKVDQNHSVDVKDFVDHSRLLEGPHGTREPTFVVL